MEEQYPELKNMKLNEMFIEFARVEKEGQILAKFRMNSIALKKDRDVIARGLKAQYQGDQVYLTTIFK